MSPAVESSPAANCGGAFPKESDFCHGICLFTFTFERCAFRLITMTGIGACHLDLVRMALTGLVVHAGRRITGNLRRLAGNLIRIAGTVIFPLTEAFTAGLISHFRIAAAHMNVILAAAVILIIGTVYNGTV